MTPGPVIDHRTRRPARCCAILAVVAMILIGGCDSGSGDDLRPGEEETGEQDTEIVPGGEGPVD